MTSAILKIDIDGGEPLQSVELTARLQRAGYRLIYSHERGSPSGRGYHQVLSVAPAPATAIEIVALQLLCGSDPRREAYNLNRARRVDTGQCPPAWRQNWNVLYGAV